MLIVSSAVCNRCGISINNPMVTIFQAKASYGSKYDGMNLSMALCPDCLDTLLQEDFADFAVPIVDDTAQ